jgi:hypothetical protein
MLGAVLVVSPDLASTPRLREDDKWKQRSMLVP